MTGPRGSEAREVRELRLPRPPGGPTPWAIGAGVVALALVAVVTASGPVDLVSQPPPGSARSVSLETPSSSPPVTGTTSTHSFVPPLESLPTLPPILQAVIQLVVAVAIGWVVALLARYAWRSFPRLSTRSVPRQALTPLPALPEELLAFADARLALLQEGSPRNAIVACWVDLEDAASAAGLPRRAHETSAEYTVRVLHTWDIAPEAMGALAELYREARYSRHPLTEAHRQAALERLTAVHDDLRRVVAEHDATAALDAAAAAAAGAPNTPSGVDAGEQRWSGRGQ